MKTLKLASAFLGCFILTTFAAFAADGGAAAGAAGNVGLIAIAAGLGMGLAVLGGTFGQSRAVAAALDGTARNPGAGNKVMVTMLLGLALIESLVIVGFLVMNGLAGKI